MSHWSLLVLGLLLVATGCRTTSASDRLFERLLAEEKPAVVLELGSDQGIPLSIEERSDLSTGFEAEFAWSGERSFCYGRNWKERTGPSIRFSVAHELVHLCSPELKSHALEEGIADVLATRVYPRAQSEVMFDYWVRGPKDRTQLAGPLLEEPQPEHGVERDWALRAVGFMVFYCMSREEIQEFVATGQSAVLDELRGLTVEALWARAAHTPQPAPLTDLDLFADLGWRQDEPSESD